MGPELDATRNAQSYIGLKGESCPIYTVSGFIHSIFPKIEGEEVLDQRKAAGKGQSGRKDRLFTFYSIKQGFVPTAAPWNPFPSLTTDLRLSK